MATVGPGRSASRAVQLALAALLLWSVGLRGWFAAEGLQPGRFWDERYNVKNLRALLVGGQLEPVSYYYPSLSYLPQAGVLALSEEVVSRFEQDFSWFDGGRLRPAGYLVCRLLQVGYGTVSILLTFLLGRRLFGSSVGLGGAFLLAASPLHIRLSTFFKPDVLLVLLVLLTLLWSLRATQRPTVGRYALAGAGVGLAVASKLNGAPAALPLAVGALTLVWRDRRHLWGLALAAVGSVTVFLLFNPWVGRYLKAVERNQELYAGRTRGDDGRSLLGVLADAVSLLVSPALHGLAIGSLGLAGLALLGFLVIRARRRSGQAVPWLMLLSFPVGYCLLYALATSYAKPNNFLPVLPFTSLAAALFAITIWRSVLGALPALGRPAPRVLAVAAAVFVVAWPAQAWVYRSLVPTTWQRALDLVAAELRPWDGRIALFEQEELRLGGRPRALRAMVRRTDDLRSLAVQTLDRTDAEVFAARRLGNEEGAFYRSRTAKLPPDDVVRIRRRPFEARGPTVVVALHAPALLGAETPVVQRSETAFSFELPDPPADGEWLSVGVWIPGGRGESPSVRLFSGDVPIRLRATVFGRRTYFLSHRRARCPSSGESGRMLLEVSPRRQERWRPEPTIYRWEPPPSLCASGASSTVSQSPVVSSRAAN